MFMQGGLEGEKTTWKTVVHGRPSSDFYVLLHCPFCREFSIMMINENKTGDYLHDDGVKLGIATGLCG